MRVELKDFTQAINKVRSLAEGVKNAPGIMLEISEDKLNVCYSDGKKSLIEKIDVLDNTENPLEGRVILNIKQIQNVVESLQPSGAIYTDEIELITEDNGRMRILGDKKVRFGGEDSTEETVRSKMNYSINYYRPEESVKYGVISRMNYEGIFDSDEYDVWAVNELRDILERTSGEKNKTIYVSSITKTAFVVNLAYVTNIPITSCENHGFVINTLVAKAVVDILSKLDAEEVKVWIQDKRYVNMISGDNNVGIWFEMSPGSRTDLNTLQRYEGKDYNKYLLVANKPVLQDVIKASLSLDDNEKTKITFVEVNGELAMRIVGSASGASSINDFNIILEMHQDNVGNILEVSIPVSLKVILDMLNKCVEDYVAIHIEVDEDNKYIRIGDIVDDDTMSLGTVNYTISSK
jgi:hypothetical protein